MGSKNRRTVGIFFEEFHNKWAWSKKRWDFVVNNMRILCDEIYWCKQSTPIINSYIEENLHLDFILKKEMHKLHIQKYPQIWSKKFDYCQSFSKFWKLTSLKE